MARKLVGFVLIHPEKEDFVFGMHLDDGLEVVLYAPTPANAKIFKDFDEIENFLLENCINGDLLITMGAGDVVKIGENLLGK